MSTDHDIDTAKQIYEAFGRGDVDAILERVTDDVDWSTDAAIESAPWYGLRHGKEGVRSFFRAIGSIGPVTEFTPMSFTSNADGDVMVFIRYEFTVTATGKHVAMMTVAHGRGELTAWPMTCIDSQRRAAVYSAA